MALNEAVDYDEYIWNLSWNLGQNSGTYLEPKWVFSGTYIIIQVGHTGDSIRNGTHLG